MFNESTILQTRARVQRTSRCHCHFRDSLRVSNWQWHQLSRAPVNYNSKLIDWLIDWQAGWLACWLTDWLAGFSDWLVWLTGWLTDCLTEWFIDRSIDRSIDRRTHRPIDRLIDRLIDWLILRVTTCELNTTFHLRVSVALDLSLF